MAQPEQNAFRLYLANQYQRTPLLGGAGGLFDWIDCFVINFNRPPSDIETNRVGRILDAQLVSSDIGSRVDELVEEIHRRCGRERGVSAADLASERIDLRFARSAENSPWSTKALDILLSSNADVRHCLRFTFCFGSNANRSTIDPWLEVYQPDYIAATSLAEHLAKLQHALNDSDALAVADIPPLFQEQSSNATEQVDTAQEIGDNTSAEELMREQVNSEHCRHHQFRARWSIDGEVQQGSLFDAIVSTSRRPDGNADLREDILSAYSDNAAVVRGAGAVSDATPLHVAIKVETHNHPTGVEPYPGAATGSGGEIRDEVAVGIGGRTVAGMVGYITAPLWDHELPASRAGQPWGQDEQSVSSHLASSRDIMARAPLGACDYNNEFGRPGIVGFFRTYLQDAKLANTDVSRIHSFFKPLMIAGGFGVVKENNILKRPGDVKTGDALLVLGGPCYRIGFGGGSASSAAWGSSDSHADAASVQRANPEMQRRVQGVLDALQEHPENPILMLHDVGAGGLSNAIPEILHDSGCGCDIDLSSIPAGETGMSAAELWCCEAQERYVAIVPYEQLPLVMAIAERERCPVHTVGRVERQARLKVVDDRSIASKKTEVDVDLDELVNPGQQHIEIDRSTIANVASLAIAESSPSRDAVRDRADLEARCYNLLKQSTVGSKESIIRIGDRTVGGLVHRDPMVGPWQLPVADCGIARHSFDATAATAMAVGERPPIATIDSEAASRVAIVEALFNLQSAGIDNSTPISASANWMAATVHEDQQWQLRQAVTELAAAARELQVAIPVGKDSLSMITKVTDQSQAGTDDSSSHSISPVTAVITAFASQHDHDNARTPFVVSHPATNTSGDPDREYQLFAVRPAGELHLGCSVYDTLYRRDGERPADVDITAAQATLQFLRGLMSETTLVEAYHDISDGGLWASLCEVAMTNSAGLQIQLPPVTDAAVSGIRAMFSEVPGAVIAVCSERRQEFARYSEQHAEVNQVCLEPLGTMHCSHDARHPGVSTQELKLELGAGEDASTLVFPLSKLYSSWSNPSDAIATWRGDPHWSGDKGTSNAYHTSLLGCSTQYQAPSVHIGANHKIAVLREAGVNSHREMLAGAESTGAEVVEIHTTELLENPGLLQDFKRIAFPGGFSFGDVLGAGNGWAQVILNNSELLDVFQRAFADDQTLVLGVCNGAQVLHHLGALIPGAEHWPQITRNESQRFEGRLLRARVPEDTAALALEDLRGLTLPVVVSHGEGCMRFPARADGSKTRPPRGSIALQYAAPNDGNAPYPSNPNGSDFDIAGMTNSDGRVLSLMPHPERSMRTWQLSWCPPQWDGEYTPWFSMLRSFAKKRD